MKNAAIGGDAQSQFAYALLYEYGGESIERDPDQSIVWLKKAGKRGIAGACLYLGLKYEYGNRVEKDVKKAACWYRCAAQKDWPAAQYMLAGMYEHGKGVRQSSFTALVWFGLAAEYEYPGAAEKFTRLYKKSGFNNLIKIEKKQKILLEEPGVPCN